MLLIITNRADLASDFLILRLRERCIPFVRFNTEDFPSRASVRIDNETRKWRWAIELRGTWHEDVEFRGVYLRHPEVAPCEEVADEHRAFAQAEVAETLRSLWRIIPDHLWLNAPGRVWLASNKLLQLSVAGDLGLRVPQTLIGNAANAIRKVANGRPKGELVVKAVKHGFVEADGCTLLAGTQAFDLKDLEVEGVSKTLPLQIQRRIRKRSDIRVVVVNGDVFATRILPAENSRSHIDWRLDQLRGADLLHQPFTLPEDVEALCRDLPTRFGLRYSSIDLIEDHRGHFWFLELNPNGQWAWIEQLTGHPIRDAIIRSFGI